LAAMLKVIEQKGLAPRDRGLIYFAIAKAYDDFSDAEKAFDYYSLANKAYREINTYDAMGDRDFHNKIFATNESFKKIKLGLSVDETQPHPIHIVGMPRSGTALVEQILSCHTQISAAGELTNIHDFGGRIISGGVFPSSEQMMLFRTSYQNELKQNYAGERYVTDKLPHNFRYISLINSLYPNSKIIHVKRDASATCWSNYIRAYGPNSLSFTYSLDHLVEFYNMYEELMEYWKDQYPQNILTIKYEELVENPQAIIRDILEFLGLSWESACLEPHKNKRAVKTSSQKQVREKIYKGSSKSWKRFEPYLNGVFDRLS